MTQECLGISILDWQLQRNGSGGSRTPLPSQPHRSGFRMVDALSRLHRMLDSNRSENFQSRRSIRLLGTTIKVIKDDLSGICYLNIDKKS